MITCITFDDISPSYLPLSKLEQLLDILTEVNIACTLFVVPNEFKSYSMRDEYAVCLRTALNLGHELAQHGYMHGENDFISEFGCLLPIPFPAYQKQKERIEKGMKRLINLTGVKPLGFRAPFYLHNNMTLRALSNLKFRYDSSKTVFKPAYSTRLRVRLLRNFKPSMIEGVTEIPVTGDYTYNLENSNFSTSLKKAVHDFKWVKSLNGIFVLNNHPNRLSGRYDFLRRFLRILVKKLSKKTDFMRLRDII